MHDAKRALRLLDLTDLSDACREDDVAKLCVAADTPHGPVAAVCIWPQFVGEAARLLKQSTVRIATVINFPKGGNNIERAIFDSREAMRDGAHEIDLVMPWQAFMDGDMQTASEMIDAVAAETGSDHVLKVILETGALQDAALIREASRLAIRAGADFIKTSTGKITVSATPEAARIMLGEIFSCCKPVGFKAAGGVRTLEQARHYLALADEIMGPAWAAPATFRIGASGLLGVLLAILDDAPPAPPRVY